MVRHTLRLVPVFIVLATAFAAGSVHAQGVPVPATSVSLRPGPSRLFSDQAAFAASERAHEPLGGLLGPDDLDHRYPGFFLGAGLGLALTTVSFVMCSESDNGCPGSQMLPLGALMTGVLGLGGAVIGGFVPKS